MRGTFIFCALLACSRRTAELHADQMTVGKKTDAATKPTAPVEPSVTVIPPPSATAVVSEPKVPLTPFLSIVPNAIARVCASR